MIKRRRLIYCRCVLGVVNEIRFAAGPRFKSSQLAPVLTGNLNLPTRLMTAELIYGCGDGVIAIDGLLW